MHCAHVCHCCVITSNAVCSLNCPLMSNFHVPCSDVWYQTHSVKCIRSRNSNSMYVTLTLLSLFFVFIFISFLSISASFGDHDDTDLLTVPTIVQQEEECQASHYSNIPSLLLKPNNAHQLTRSAAYVVSRGARYKYGITIRP